MRFANRNSLLILWGASLFWGASQQFAAQPELLTLDKAVQLALEHNRSIEQSNLGAAAWNDAVAAAKTQRRPSFKFGSTTGMLLTQPTITFEQGTFGEYPGIGSVPGKTTTITSQRQPTAILTGEVALPLTQQIRIGLNIEQMRVRAKSAREQVRLTQHEVVKQVRQTYYAILQSQSSLDAVEHTLALLHELSQQASHFVQVGTALDGDLLNVKARLAQAEYDKAALLGPLATQREQLNLLLGRPLETGFRVASAVEAAWIPELPQARERALSARPEIQQARLKVQEADLERRKKKSERIPDVSLAVTYYSAINVSSTLPRNVAIAGVQTNWEPFDWGRKRHELSQKEKGVREARLALQDLEDKVCIEVGGAYRKMHEARLLLAASRSAQESTREAARVASVRFRMDAALLKHVLEAQANLASADDHARKALLAYWMARAELESAIGEEP